VVATNVRVHGIGIGSGTAVGVVLRMPDALGDPPDMESTADPLDEYARVSASLAATAADLVARAERSGGEGRDVLEAQALMAEDPSVIEDARARIDEGKTAERAVFEAFREFQRVLEGMGGYMAGRAADLRDVSQRAVAHLRGVPVPGVPDSDIPFVLVAHDLAPADTALLDLDKVLAIVTRDGGPTSHTAILARSKGLVAVVGAAGSDALYNGQLVVVDASSGTVSPDPSAQEVEDARTQPIQAVIAGRLTPGALADGRAVPLLANLGSPQDAAAAVALGAEGVGLFRTEFLFLDAHQAPTLEQQQAQYTALLRAFDGKRVVVRVLDAGADKQLAFLQSTEEENPALGRRGIRALRHNEQILRDQLSALAGAQRETGAVVNVMAPMVADLEETRYFVALGREVGLSSLGVTVEVPSAALLADQLAPEVDFMSIGTNDLTQYTMAADRMLGTVSHYQDPWHPAVLRLIKSVGDAGSSASVPVGVCGEAASDPLLAIVLVGLGATDLSMAPSALAEVRASLRRVSLADAQSLDRLAMQATSAASARAAVSEQLASASPPTPATP
jgi:phosphotransferase system enzyme I (PtsI)